MWLVSGLYHDKNLATCIYTWSIFRLLCRTEYVNQLVKRQQITNCLLVQMVAVSVHIAVKHFFLSASQPYAYFDYLPLRHRSYAQ